MLNHLCSSNFFSNSPIILQVRVIVCSYHFHHWHSTTLHLLTIDAVFFRVSKLSAKAQSYSILSDEDYLLGKPRPLFSTLIYTVPVLPYFGSWGHDDENMKTISHNSISWPTWIDDCFTIPECFWEDA